MRIIDADALEQFFLDETKQLRKQIINDEVSDEEAVYIRSVMPAIEWARQTVHICPTVDAVKVVRCKDCDWYREDGGICVNPKCGKSWYGCPVPDQHYCSFGERRE
jgi:hypothetical protein